MKVQRKNFKRVRSHVEPEVSGVSVKQAKRKRAQEDAKLAYASTYKSLVAGEEEKDGAETSPERKSQVAARPSPSAPATPSKANLEIAKTGNRNSGSTLLIGDEHKGLLRKAGRDPAEVRPDIAHQCLLALLDSPLNKAGRLQVYIRTVKNVLIEVHPDLRIPRTFKRFAGLMAELLAKFKIRATNSQDTLLKVIRNPITSHLPVNCKRFAFSYSSDEIVNVVDHAPKVMSENPEAAVYVIGAMAKGKVHEP